MWCSCPLPPPPPPSGWKGAGRTLWLSSLTRGESWQPWREQQRRHRSSSRGCRPSPSRPSRGSHPSSPTVSLWTGSPAGDSLQQAGIAAAPLARWCLHLPVRALLFCLCVFFFFALQAPKHRSFTVSQPVFKRSRHGRNVGGLGATRCGRVTFKMCPSEATKRNVGRALTSAVCVCLCVCILRVSKRPLLSYPWGRVVRRTTALGAVSSPLRWKVRNQLGVSSWPLLCFYQSWTPRLMRA